MKQANKKKTSKEKRVLIGALCIAAAITVGSTFAWFTSQDDVTNRLSANADYNVSIVESFEPPANWIPGQTINKDVYATNTGNIGAFVEEEVSGVLTITNETPVAVSAFNAATCVELTEEERYVMEAGSYLAYKPSNSLAVLGNQIVIRPTDQGTPVKTDFTPDETGLYVFRRQIVVAADQSETFDYEGYYYDKITGKYFKIANLRITPDAEVDFANDGVATDGNLSAASCDLVTETTQVIKPIDLEYDATGHKLVASYDTGIANSAFTDLENAAARLDAANHMVEYLTELVARATSENATNTSGTSTANSALTTARNELNDALTAQSTAATALLTATTAYNNATAAKTAAQAAYDESKTKLFGTGTASAPAAGSLLKIYQDATAAKDSWNTAYPSQRDAFEAEIAAWLGTTPAGVDSTHTTLASLTVAELQLFTPSSELHDYYELEAAELIAKTNYENEMMKAYGKKDGGEGSGNYTEGSLYGVLQTAITALGDSSSGATKAYNDAVAAKNTADTNVATAQTNYKNALDAYTAALDANSETAATLAELTAQLTAATAEKDAANTAYTTAQTAANAATSATKVLKFNINLNNDVTAGGTADKWQVLPNPIVDNVAKFYYTSILEGGETSTKLIDSVELDASATQDMYKSFDFDLNVALKSVQITYADDQKTILATGTTTEFGKTATLATPTDVNTALTWS